MKKFIIPFSFVLILFITILYNIGLYKSIPNNNHLFSSKYGHKEPKVNSNLRIATSLWKNIRMVRIKDDDYIVKDDIGKGGWSKVFKGLRTPTGNTVALKYFYYEEGIKLQRELTILEDLKDAPNFLPLQDLFEGELDGKEAIVSVYDCFEKQSYKDIFFNLTKYTAKKFMYETLRTLEYAHKRWIIHRDIKPPNVLMNTKTLEVRVIDWGISEYYVPSKRLPVDVGTIPFQPPEVLLGYQYYGTSFDIWSTACMFAEMAFQRVNFFHTKREKPEDQKLTPEEDRKQRYRELLDDIAKVLGSEDLLTYADKIKDLINMENLNFVGKYHKQNLRTFMNKRNEHLVDEVLIDLLEKMFVYDPNQRITASEALLHPYFDEVRGST